MSTLYLVSRHPGAVQWMRRRAGHAEVRVLTHLDSRDFDPQPGDQVWGVVPLPWIERIQRQGAECWVLEVAPPPELRGHELDEARLDSLGAKLVHYNVRALDVLA